MGGLLASLTASGSALSAFGRSLEVIQNNVTNASTPGYVRQSLDLVATGFDGAGLGGGVEAGEMHTSRSEYAEQAVRRGVANQGRNETYATLLGGIEGLFDISGEAGIPGGMNTLYEAFSAWSITPNDRGARQSVIDAAGSLAQSFQLASAELTQASRGADLNLASDVTSINEIAARLSHYNAELRRGNRSDAGLDAEIHSTLEELAQLVDTTVIRTSDGSLTVLAGGQVPLVIGERSYPLELRFGQPSDPAPVYPNGPVNAQIVDAGGNDVTNAFTGGKLAGTLAFRNGTITQLLGDAYRAGELNTLAKSLADRVNSILASGVTDSGLAPAAGLFTYDSTNDTAVARTLTVDALMTTTELGPADPGPPPAANGTVLKLMALETPSDAADMIDGSSFMGYYSRIAASVGRAAAQATQDGETAMTLAAQARTMRDTLSGVSLDSEAIQLTQYQRAYEASAKMISVLADLTEVALGIIR